MTDVSQDDFSSRRQVISYIRAIQEDNMLSCKVMVRRTLIRNKTLHEHLLNLQNGYADIPDDDETLEDGLRKLIHDGLLRGSDGELRWVSVTPEGQPCSSSMDKRSGGESRSKTDPGTAPAALSATAQIHKMWECQGSYTLIRHGQSVEICCTSEIRLETLICITPHTPRTDWSILCNHACFHVEYIVASRERLHALGNFE